MHPTSGRSDGPNLYPHMRYMPLLKPPRPECGVCVRGMVLREGRGERFVARPWVVVKWSDPGVWGCGGAVWGCGGGLLR